MSIQRLRSTFSRVLVPKMTVDGSSSAYMPGAVDSAACRLFLKMRMATLDEWVPLKQFLTRVFRERHRDLSAFVVTTVHCKPCWPSKTLTMVTDLRRKESRNRHPFGVPLIVLRCIVSVCSEFFYKFTFLEQDNLLFLFENSRLRGRREQKN
ncbi:hypothetical protein [Paraburkholderia dilworthii]|uniref:hypothetical protein n=1 Tax=Paraburkholderia dilworthii TaxID=948106 RepID=UPI0004879F0E|nr:hypothetical protein [Paraburkholderia dilworthii]